MTVDDVMVLVEKLSDQEKRELVERIRGDLIPVSTPDADDEPLWTETELEAMLKTEPLTGAEIVEGGFVGGWEHRGIHDSVEFLEQLRRKRREKFQR